MPDNFGDKKNTNGFDKNPQNINRKGTPISIKNQLKQLMVKDGTLPIPKDFLKSEDEKNYYFKLPTQEMLALKLVTTAMGKGKDAFQALKLMLETFDGKPTQPVKQSTDLNINNYSDLTVEELENKLNDIKTKVDK